MNARWLTTWLRSARLALAGAAAAALLAACGGADTAPYASLEAADTAEVPTVGLAYKDVGVPSPLVGQRRST